MAGHTNTEEVEEEEGDSESEEDVDCQNQGASQLTALLQCTLCVLIH